MSIPRRILLNRVFRQQTCQCGLKLGVYILLCFIHFALICETKMFATEGYISRLIKYIPNHLLPILFTFTYKPSYSQFYEYKIIITVECSNFKISAFNKNYCETELRYRNKNIKHFLVFAH